VDCHYDCGSVADRTTVTATAMLSLAGRTSTQCNAMQGKARTIMT